MKIIVDTNIVFSAILNTNNKIGDLILNSEQNFEFTSVTYLKFEIEKHKDKLIQMSKLDSIQIEESKNLIFSKIEFISEEIIPFEYWKEAANIVRDVDMDDIAFVALSKYLGDVLLWTGDKKLLEGIKSKGFNEGISTDELIEIRKNLDKQKSSEEE